MTDAVRFFREFLRLPGLVGAVAPSSPALARAMVQGLDLERASAVIEYGPGLGAFTSAILERIPRQCRYLAVEINPAFASALRERHPALSVRNASVLSIRSLCDEEGIEAADCIISGLPWAAFSEREQSDLLAATLGVLRPGGRFATFAYLQGLLLPAGRRFRHRLTRTFREVGRSPVVWRNLPPAFIYRCRL